MAERNNKIKDATKKSRDDASRVRDIMVVPGDVLHPDHDLHEAQVRLERSGLSVLPVVDGDEVVGILTGQALEARRVAPPAPEAAATVTDYMSASLPICRVDEALNSAAEVMDREGKPGLLVIDTEDQLVGVITREMLEEHGYPFTGTKQRRASTTTPHAVKSAARARGEPHGWLKSYSVKPQVRR